MKIDSDTLRALATECQRTTSRLGRGYIEAVLDPEGIRIEGRLYVRGQNRSYNKVVAYKAVAAGGMVALARAIELVATQLESRS